VDPVISLKRVPMVLHPKRGANTSVPLSVVPHCASHLARSCTASAGERMPAWSSSASASSVVVTANSFRFFLPPRLVPSWIM
jgi:hypothetical protein